MTMFKYIWNYFIGIIRMSWNAPHTISGGLDMRFSSNKELAKRKTGCSCILGIIVFIIIIIDSLSVNEKVVKETSDSTRVKYQTIEKNKSIKVSPVSIYEEVSTKDTTEISEPITNLERECNPNVDFVEGNIEIIPTEKGFMEVALPGDS